MKDIMLGFPGGTSGKEPARQCKRHESWLWSLRRDPLEKGMATHPSLLAWRIPWTEEPDGLQAMGSQSRTQLRDFHFHFFRQNFHAGIDLTCCHWDEPFAATSECLSWFPPQGRTLSPRALCGLTSETRTRLVGVPSWGWVQGRGSASLPHTSSRLPSPVCACYAPLKPTTGSESAGHLLFRAAQSKANNWARYRFQSAAACLCALLPRGGWNQAQCLDVPGGPALVVHCCPTHWLCVCVCVGGGGSRPSPWDLNPFSACPWHAVTPKPGGLVPANSRGHYWQDLACQWLP